MSSFNINPFCLIKTNNRLHNSLVSTINECNSCNDIGMHFNATLQEYHRVPRKNTNVYKILETIYDTHPRIINHKDCCINREDYKSVILQMINLSKKCRCIKQSDNYLKKINFSYNPNMLILDELPLEHAIINNNLIMVDWLVSLGAILYVHNNQTSHFPIMTNNGDLLPNINHIDNDILEVIINAGAFGNPLSMLNFMYRLYKIDKKNIKLYNLICKLLYRFDIDFWKYHTSLPIYCMLNEFMI